MPLTPHTDSPPFNNTAALTPTANLALFDLDHTLLPLDSDHEWGRFLVRIGAVDAEDYTRRNDQFYADYRAGTLDILAYLRFVLAPLAAQSRQTLADWHQRFMEEVIQPVMTPQAQALVQQHQQAGDLCCVVTATNSFITRPIVQQFGVPHLIAPEPALRADDDGIGSPYTGELDGIPSYREGKVLRTEAWLQSQGKTWHSFPKTFFYTDSVNDIPLMEKVSHPVATNPDDRLRALAEQRGWRVLELFT